MYALPRKKYFGNVLHKPNRKFLLSFAFYTAPCYYDSLPKTKREEHTPSLTIIRCGCSPTNTKCTFTDNSNNRHNHSLRNLWNIVNIRYIFTQRISQITNVCLCICSLLKCCLAWRCSLQRANSMENGNRMICHIHMQKAYGLDRLESEVVCFNACKMQ